MIAVNLSRWAKDWGQLMSAIAVAVFTLFLWLATRRMAKATTDVVVATAASVEAARDSAAAANASSEVSRELLSLDRERWQAEQLRSQSVEHWTAHVMPSGARTAAKVVRIHNRGPGTANVQMVEVELENRGDPGVTITHSETYPVEVQAGEYFRIDLHVEQWRPLRAVVTWYDGRGSEHPNVKRVRILEPTEPAV